MIDQRINLPVEAPEARKTRAEKIAAMLARLDVRRPYEVVVRPKAARRSGQQNAYLWSLYEFIIERGGPDMEGWEKEDLHTFFCGEHFGWEVRTLYGKTRMRPVKRSSRLNKQEFGDYLEFVSRFMAQRGVYLPSPEEDWNKVA